MKLELAKAERLLISQIVNIKLDSATLRDHILLEGIFHAVKPLEIEIPTPPEFVPQDKKSLFEKYENQRVSDIQDEEDKKVISEAIRKSREKEMELYTNLDETDTFELTEEEVRTLKDFFEKDKRPFSRELHEAIISLHNKLSA